MRETYQKLALSVEEAAACTGIGKNTLRDLIRTQKIPSLRIGRKILIRSDALEDFLKRCDGRDLRSMGHKTVSEI